MTDRAFFAIKAPRPFFRSLKRKSAGRNDMDFMMEEVMSKTIERPFVSDEKLHLPIFDRGRFIDGETPHVPAIEHHQESGGSFVSFPIGLDFIMNLLLGEGLIGSRPIISQPSMPTFFMAWGGIGNVAIAPDRAGIGEIGTTRLPNVEGFDMTRLNDLEGVRKAPMDSEILADIPDRPEIQITKDRGFAGFHQIVDRVIKGPIAPSDQKGVILVPRFLFKP